MARYCFVHAADLHLDTPFEGVRRAAPEVQAALVDASLEAWDALVELTLERDALFLLLAGDLYDGARRGLRAQLRLLRGIERLCAAGVRVFAVQGNHDPVGEGWSAVRRWPEGFTLFGSEAVANVPLERGGSRLATVYGISYAERATRENLALRFRRGSEEGLHVGLLHCNVGGASGHEPYSPCSVEDLARSRLDYWALGHIHTQRILREGDPWIVYPGSLQGRSPKPGELGAKGAVVVEVEGQRVTGVEPVFVDRVRFLAPEVDAARCSDIADLERALWSAAEAARRLCVIAARGSRPGCGGSRYRASCGQSSTGRPCARGTTSPPSSWPRATPWRSTTRPVRASSTGCSATCRPGSAASTCPPSRRPMARRCWPKASEALSNSSPTRLRNANEDRRLAHRGLRGLQ